MSGADTSRRRCLVECRLVKHLIATTSAMSITLRSRLLKPGSEKTSPVALMGPHQIRCVKCRDIETTDYLGAVA